ncbi:MAG: response regulator [Deltaproteobacteria bacterium]|nr:response regulator [Deltaproteobacteria bacterium]
MRFLIVDDSETSQAIIQSVVTSMGHKVAGIAVNGRDALEKFTSLQPDVVVLDVIMPVVNGLDALKDIRSRDPNALVIMISSTRSPQTALECQQAGASFFLYKSMLMTDLPKIIHKIQTQA